MVKINYAVLEFDHVVEFIRDNTVFAAARENGSGHIRLFLITNTGSVYTRNGRVDSWEELFGTDRENILILLSAARSKNIPVYRINGSHNN